MLSLLKTDIANLALGRLGSSLKISDFDLEQTAQAKAIRVHFQTTLVELLEYHEWGFATAYEELALVEENPTPTWGYAYTAPSDAIVVQQIASGGIFQVKETYDDEREKFIEAYSPTGVQLFTNIGLAWAQYTKFVGLDFPFPNHFGQALSAKLALMIAPSIITNNFAKVKNVLLDDAKRAINDGIAADLNRKPRPETSESRFVRVR